MPSFISFHHTAYSIRLALPGFLQFAVPSLAAPPRRFQSCFRYHIAGESLQTLFLLRLVSQRADPLILFVCCCLVFFEARVLSIRLSRIT